MLFIYTVQSPQHVLVDITTQKRPRFELYSDAERALKQRAFLAADTPLSPSPLPQSAHLQICGDGIDWGRSVDMVKAERGLPQQPLRDESVPVQVDEPKPPAESPPAPCAAEATPKRAPRRRKADSVGDEQPPKRKRPAA